MRRSEGPAPLPMVLALALGCGSTTAPPQRASASAEPAVDPLVALQMPPIGPPRFPSAAPTPATPPPTAPPTASAEPSAVATAVEPPPIQKPASPPLAKFIYRESFTGEMSGRTERSSWTLELYAGNVAVLEREKWVGPQLSYELVPSFPIPDGGTFARESLTQYAATWTGSASGSLTLTLANDPTNPLACAATSLDVLPATARIVIVEVNEARRATWAFKGARTKTSALVCARGGVAERATWIDEPQPLGLAFAAPPGLEYAHENSSDSLQLGGLRAWVEP